MAALLEFRDVVKTFDGAKVLDGVSFAVEKGEVFCIVGPSGTGKSVTLKHFVRLLEADSGQVLVDGTPIYHAKDLKVGLFVEAPEN